MCERRVSEEREKEQGSERKRERGGWLAGCHQLVGCAQLQEFSGVMTHVDRCSG